MKEKGEEWRGKRRGKEWNEMYREEQRRQEKRRREMKIDEREGKGKERRGKKSKENIIKLKKVLLWFFRSGKCPPAKLILEQVKEISTWRRN